MTFTSAYVPPFTPYGPGSGPNADEPPPQPAPLPIGEAEGLLATLPGVLSARIVATAQGGVGDVHVLTGADVTPRQTVRNVETALFARFGVRVEARRISVATTTGPLRRPAVSGGPERPSAPGRAAIGADLGAVPGVVAAVQRPDAGAAGGRSADARRLYFEDVEARRSLRGGVSCRVVLRRGEVAVDEGDALVEGEAESLGTLRAQADEVAARAALDALACGAAGAGGLVLEGSARVAAFGREFVLVGVVARRGRGATLLTGSAEVRDGGAEAAAVLAVLDATNRWVERA